MSMLAVVALIVPQSVSATCDIPFQRLQVGFTEVGQKTVGGNLGFGEGQTVLAGDISTQLNEKWRGQAGLGICRIGSTEITYGFKIDTELFRSVDGKIGVFAGAGLNRVSASGVATLLLPVTAYGTMIVSPLATLFFGPSLSYVRISNGVFSGSNTNLGFQGGVMYELQDGLCIVVGGDFQDFELGSTFRIQTGVYFDLN
jgi:hypothetical protein